MSILRYWASAFFLFLGMGFLSQCKTDDSFVPAYLEITSIEVDATSIEGNSIHEIIGVQPVHNGQSLGTFPIPCKIPINAEGTIKMQFVAFVKNNGNSANWVPYRTLVYLDTQVTLSREKTTTFTPKFTYRSNTEVSWQEDFESGNSTLVPVRLNKGDTTSIESRSFDLNGKFKGNTNVFVTKFGPNDSLKFIDLSIFDKIPSLPNDGREVFMEFDVKSDLLVTLALKRYNSAGSAYVQYMSVNPTKGNWRRIYSNLIYEVQGQPAGTKYEIYFSIDKPEGFSGNREILIDNIRLTYLK